MQPVSSWLRLNSYAPTSFCFWRIPGCPDRYGSEAILTARSSKVRETFFAINKEAKIQFGISFLACIICPEARWRSHPVHLYHPDTEKHRTPVSKRVTVCERLPHGIAVEIFLVRKPGKPPRDPCAYLTAAICFKVNTSITQKREPSWKTNRTTCLPGLLHIDLECRCAVHSATVENTAIGHQVSQEIDEGGSLNVT